LRRPFCLIASERIMLGVDYVHGFMGARDNSLTFNGGELSRTDSPGHRHRHRARQLQIRRPRHRQILTALRPH
jgi:hypothetical protein